jgi:hypothetical protein
VSYMTSNDSDQFEPTSVRFNPDSGF